MWKELMPGNRRFEGVAGFTIAGMNYSCGCGYSALQLLASNELGASY
jgi:hypothetical protein